MIILSPTTSAQEFNIVPRDPNELKTLVLTITEDGARTTETFSDVSAWTNGDYITISQAFTILVENRTYQIIITQDGDNWYRGRARCTSQSNKAIKHTLNTVADDGYLTLEENNEYTTLQ